MKYSKILSYSVHQYIPVTVCGCSLLAVIPDLLGIAIKETFIELEIENASYSIVAATFQEVLVYIISSLFYEQYKYHHILQ